MDTTTAIVHGRIQGVGFRRAVAQKASGLKLRGQVRNLSDGTVEVVVCGPEVEVAMLLMSLQTGMPGTVERVEVSRTMGAFVNPDPDADDFQIVW